MYKETKTNNPVDLKPRAVELQLEGIELARYVIEQVEGLEQKIESVIYSTKKEFETLGLDVFDEDREGFSKASNPRSKAFWQI